MTREIAKKAKRTLGRGLQDLSKISPTEVAQTIAATPAVQTVSALDREQTFARVICVTSGKGGTGKSIFSSNLATHFAQLGQKVIILDADLGLSNIHLLFGLAPTYNVSDLLNRKESLKNVMMRTPFGPRLISGGSGLTELANLSDHHIEQLTLAFADLEKEADLLLIDTPASIVAQTMMFLYAANEIIVVTTPEITAIADAYATIKVIVQQNHPALIALVINRVRSKKEGEMVFSRLNKACQQFLNKELVNYGHIRKIER